MKRVVYSPKVSAFVKADTGVYDLSPYIVRGNVTRSLDQVSTASLEFRNPGKKFTQGKQGAIFHPMDPILVFMTRLEEHPVHVFTGYIDSSPYFTLKPGIVGLTASCTLKKLLYTYFDPGLDFFHRFLHQRGWQTTPGLGVTSVGDNPDGTVDDNAEDPSVPDRTENESGNLNDSSFGDLLYDTVRYIGNWPDDTIWIENLPEGIVDLVEGIFYQVEDASEEQRKKMFKLIKQILAHNEISAGGLGGGGGGGTATTTGETHSPVRGDITGLNNPAHERFCQIVAGGTGLSLRVLAAWCDVEGGPEDNPLNIGPGHSFGSIEAGAEATIDLLAQDLYSMIMDAAGKSDEEQLRAIASSPWLTGQPVFTQSYYDNLHQIWGEITVQGGRNS